ncbi:MAG: MBL fold metallo-hydrolase [Myxococcales bacterium]|nr:MBL fold metallo-hydrolase [Myxococcales bacterium]
MRLNDEAGVEPSEAQEVAVGLVRVPLRSRTLPPATRTNAYVIRGDRHAWVVDPGADESDEQQRLEVELDRACERWDAELGGIIATHHHPDHVAGVGALAARRGCAVLAESRTHGLAAARVGAASWRTFDGDTEVDGLHLVFTPGHAPGHVCVWTGGGGAERVARALIAGDLVAGVGTIVVNPPRGDMSAYLTSLTRAAALQPALLLPAHGPATHEAVERLEAYRTHRLAREARVLAAVDSSEARDLAAITAIAYADVPPYSHPMASRAALAHLRKLVQDGAVVEDGERFLAV